MAEGFISYEADRNGESIGDRGKQLCVKPGVGTYGTLLVLQKIGGKGGV